MKPSCRRPIRCPAPDDGGTVGPLVAGALFAAVTAQGLYLGMAAAIAAAALFDRLRRQEH